MREVDPVAVELDYALLLRELDVVDSSSRQRLEQRHRGSRKGGDCNERLTDTRRQIHGVDLGVAVIGEAQGHPLALGRKARRERHPREVRRRLPAGRSRGCE